jgi:hypothetical protein
MAVVLDASTGAGAPVPLAHILSRAPSEPLVVVAVRHFA